MLGNGLRPMRSVNYWTTALAPLGGEGGDPAVAGEPVEGGTAIFPHRKRRNRGHRYGAFAL